MADLELSTLDGAGSPLVVALIGEFDVANVDPLKECLAPGFWKAPAKR